MLPPASIEPGPLMSLSLQVYHYPFWANLACAKLKLLFKHHLILDFADLVRINRAWLYKEANAKLTKKGECWNWNQRSRGSILTGVTFCYWNFLFSWSKVSDANIGIIANVVCL